MEIRVEGNWGGNEEGLVLRICLQIEGGGRGQRSINRRGFRQLTLAIKPFKLAVIPGCERSTRQVARPSLPDSRSTPLHKQTAP